MQENFSRNISLKPLRENHRAAYYALVGSAWAVLGFILLLALLLLVSLFNPWVHFGVVISGSMEPNMSKGSMIIVVPRSEYHQGDIINFSAPVIGNNTHRIVGEVEMDGVTYFVTKGDAFEEPDRTLVPVEKIRGKVEMIFPYLGYVAYSGFFGALVPISLLVIYLIRKRRSRQATSG
jgi:signal peptidase